MEELAKVLVLLALLASVLAYIRGDWGELGHFWRLKLVGEPT